MLQACRGDKLDDGALYKHDALPTSQRQYRISKESDFLVAYSVVPGTSYYYISTVVLA